MGGFVPKGRIAEDGKISDKYPNLIETKTTNYTERTELNVINSDATIIFSHGNLTGGSLLTRKSAEKHKKLFLHINLLEEHSEIKLQKAKYFLQTTNCKTLNIAGSRASEDSKIYQKTKIFLTNLFD
jgi:UDP-N-acetylglucosamine transferase subunit ALG13